MAALLCVKPCQVCGEACDDCAKCLATNCEFCCECCEDGCAGFCEFLEEFFEKPYSCCVFFTVMTNLGCMGGFIYYMATAFNGACASLHIWLFVALLMFIFNLCFAFYLFKRLSKMEVPEYAEGKKPKSAVQEEFERTWKFFMYDPVVCIYIIVIVAEFAWVFVGWNWVRTARTIDGCTGMAEAGNIGGWTLLVFVLLGVGCIIFGMCQGLCDQAFEDSPLLKCCCCCIYYPCIEPCKERSEDRRRKRHQRRQQKNGGIGGGDVHVEVNHHESTPIAAPIPAAQVAQPYQGQSGGPSYPQAQVAQPYQAPAPAAQPQYQAAPAPVPQAQPYQAAPAPQPHPQAGAPVGTAYVAQPAQTAQPAKDAGVMGKAKGFAGKGIGKVKGLF